MQLVDARRDDLLKSDLKFTELVADTCNSLRIQGDLQRRLGQFKTFLPRPVISVLANMAGKDVEEFLRPRQAEVTVLFCDIRGSCRIAEQGQHDLMRLWTDVCGALGIMSSSILEEDGVIGDFQGDAVMAFWGWPLDNGQLARTGLARRPDDQPAVCRATGRCRRWGRFAAASAWPHGTAVVGRLGTPDQFKIGVFGPTVNLAARLESLTKRFGVSILVDENCAAYLREEASRLGSRMQRLGRIQPVGMTHAVAVAELTPDADQATEMLVRSQSVYDLALEAFEQGRWDEARPSWSR